MDEHEALKRIFQAAAIVREKMRVFELADATRKEAKEALEGAQLDLSNIIEEERTGQSQLPFTDAEGKPADGEHVADEARMEGAGPKPIDKATARKARRERLAAEKGRHGDAGKGDAEKEEGEKGDAGRGDAGKGDAEQ